MSRADSDSPSTIAAGRPVVEYARARPAEACGCAGGLSRGGAAGGGGAIGVGRGFGIEIARTRAAAPPLRRDFVRIAPGMTPRMVTSRQSIGSGCDAGRDMGRSKKIVRKMFSTFYRKLSENTTGKFGCRRMQKDASGTIGRGPMGQEQSGHGQ